jgi:DNA-binding CsgD family transcriptional regulator
MSRPSAIGFEHLHTQLKITNKLLAAQLRDKLKQVELIDLLASTGATDQEIADALNTTPGTVSVTKAKLKKRAQARSSAMVPRRTDGAATQ